MRSSCCSRLGGRVRSALYYRTAKLVEIRNAKLGLLHFGLVALILGYVVGYVIVYRQAYQTESRLVAAFFSKVKGVAFAERADGSRVVFDAIDVVQPPLENNALFVGLRFALTSGQRRGVCAGNYNSSDSLSELCSSGCEANHTTWNGFANGTCDHSSGFCFVSAWCPLEPPDDRLPKTALRGAEQLTVFLRANVAFPAFGITIDNVGQRPPVLFNASAPSPAASIWSVADLVALAGSDMLNVSRKGALVAAVFQYDCDFNSGADCLPQVSFSRVDDPASDSAGFNYRRVVYSDGGEVRDVYKWFGLRLTLLAAGTGKKFTSIVNAVQALGSGIALIALATLVADLLVEYVLPHRRKYKASKIKEVDDLTDDEAGENPRPLLDGAADRSLN